MISDFEQPKPHKSLTLSGVQLGSKHASSNLTTRAILRSHSLPTPALSPAPSQASVSFSASSSSAFSSPLANILTLGSPAGSFNFARSESAINSSQRSMCQYMPVISDTSCLARPTLESVQREQFESFRASKSRVVRLSGLPASPDISARAVASLFPILFSHSPEEGFVDGSNNPIPVRMWTLRANVVEYGEERPVWAVFTSHEEAFAALTPSSVYDSSLGCSPVNVLPALESELEPFSKLQSYMPNPLSALGSATHLIQPRVTGMQNFMRYPPSPTSTDTETEAELFFPDAQDDQHFGHGPGNTHALGIGYGSAQAMTPAMRERAIHTIEALQTMQACGFTLSTNPPKAHTGFRHGDWICAARACAAHNFGRNVTCIQCAAPRPSNLEPGNGGNMQVNTQVTLSIPPVARNISPRFANSVNMQPQSQTRQFRQQQGLLLKAQLQAQAQATTHPLLTPSGRAFAVGGKVQNISSDPLAPCIMFWPDNEPLPEPGQIRPASLGNAAHPPIMNTGNKGPIERQPGDWVCLKCNYLNWRRRKVCQTCFPYAEGNGDSVSATMHAERLALLAAVYGQIHPQITNAHAQASQQFPGREQHRNGAVEVPVPITSPQYPSAACNAIMLSGHPLAMSSSHRSQFPSPSLRSQIPSPSVSTSVTDQRGFAGMSQSGPARRMQTASEAPLGGGNIVYETPPSPALTRPPPSISSGLARAHDSPPQTLSSTCTGSFFPSALKHEVQSPHTQSRHVPSAISTTPLSTGMRSPASLSPTSSTSADLPLDEHGGFAKSVGVIGSSRNTGFYAYPRGAGSGSSMGSSSSLTLAGGSSIWSLERDEDKAWKSDASVAAEAFKNLSLQS